MSTATITTTVTPLDEFVNDCYDRLEGWEAGGERFDEFVAARGIEVADGYAAFFEDLRLHLSALENPERLVGRVYTPADLLVDLRYLRDVTKTTISGQGQGMARRVSAPRTKFRWGMGIDANASAEAGSAYQMVTDDLAGRLARAIKAAQ